MNPPARRGSARPSSAPLLLVLGAALLYTVATLGEYAASPLGRVPLLDSRESLELAKQFAGGSVATEPFYRAPLFPALLALLLKLGWPAQGLADGARLLNALAHVLTTALVCATAGRLWNERRAAIVGGVLFGLYPLAQHFAGDVQDTTIGVLLFVVALHAIVRSFDADASGPARAAWSAAACIALGLAVAARPHYAAALAGWLAYAAWLAGRRALRWPVLAAGFAGAAVPLLALGLANVAVSGRFAVLPSQGSYALWAANGPGANGRYYAQAIPTGERTEGTNPARYESERLYVEATGMDPRTDRRAYERYWRDLTIAHVASHPFRFANLLATKAYYLLHDFEQYNTRTYHFHKARQRLLRFNPLGWGVLVLLALYSLLRAGPARDPARRAVLLVALAYAAGVIIYFVGDRFRYPLVPVAALFAAGVLSVPRSRIPVRAAAVLAVAAVLVFWPLPRALRDATVSADWLLLAEAHNALGEYPAARAAASQVMQLAPDDPRPRDSACLLHYNEFLASFSGEPPPSDRIAAALADCDRATGARARQHAALWHHAAGHRTEALAIWRSLAAASGGAADEARAALVSIGAADAPAPPSWEAASEAQVEAHALRGSIAACGELQRRWGASFERRSAAAAALLGVPARPCDTPRRDPAE